MERDDVSNETFAILHDARKVMLAAVHAEVLEYFSDASLVFDSPDEFPSRQWLTGEYYLGNERYFTDLETGRSRVAVEARCLGHPLPSQTGHVDYLGLDVWLEYSPEHKSFTSYRNTDSSVI